MNALGQGTVGLTVLGGEHLVDLGTAVCGATSSVAAVLSQCTQLSATFSAASGFDAVPLRTAGLSASMDSGATMPGDLLRVQDLSARIGSDSAFAPLLNLSHSLAVSFRSESSYDTVFTRIIDLSAGFETSSTMPKSDLVHISWGAAITIDIPDDVTYPLIVVSEIVEDAPTNSISVRAF